MSKSQFVIFGGTTVGGRLTLSRPLRFNATRAKIHDIFYNVGGASHYITWSIGSDPIGTVPPASGARFTDYIVSVNNFNGGLVQFNFYSAATDLLDGDDGFSMTVEFME